jgi:ketosteroid isomerase-like protein
MSDHNVALVRRGLEAAQRGEFEAFLELVDPAIRLYPRTEEPGVRSCYEGHDGMVEYLANWYSGWAEYTVAPERFIDAGEYVIVDMREVGVTEQTGMRVEGTFAHAIRLAGGKAIEWRMYGPVSEALEALGIELDTA